MTPKKERYKIIDDKDGFLVFDNKTEQVEAGFSTRKEAQEFIADCIVEDNKKS